MKTASGIIVLAATDLAVSSGGDIHSFGPGTTQAPSVVRREPQTLSAAEVGVPRPGGTPSGCVLAVPFHRHHPCATPPAPQRMEPANKHVTQAGPIRAFP